MDSHKKSIIKLLKAHQPMSINNLLVVASSAVGGTEAAGNALVELIDEGAISRNSNGTVMVA